MSYTHPMPGDNWLKQLYTKKYSYRKIAVRTGINYSSVCGRLSRMIRQGEIASRRAPPKYSFGELLRGQRLAGENAPPVEDFT